MSESGGCFHTRPALTTGNPSEERVTSWLEPSYKARWIMGVDDLFGRIKEGEPMAAGVDALFIFEGRVLDTNQKPVPNLPLSAVVNYHQIINGQSTPGRQILSFGSDANGNYSYTFPGPGNPLQGYDESWGLIVTVGAAGSSGYGTMESGQYVGAPTITYPTPNTVQVADTIVRKN